MLEEAEKCLANRIEQIRQARIYGIRPKRLFREAATKYLIENQHKRSIVDDALHLKQLDSYIGELNLEQVHMGTLQAFIQTRKNEGRKAKTINLALGVVRHILNLASSEWLDEFGLTWLHTTPKIKMLSISDARTPYPLSWDEQDKLFNELPEHLRNMALFKVNTGCREQEVCQLRWDWEVEIPELGISIFLIPSQLVKNKEERLVVLNEIAHSVIEKMRGQHHEYVFTFKGKSVRWMNNTAWQKARRKVGLEKVRIHDLKHTFGRRLRAAGVSFEDRQDLLGHKSAKITTHYSSAEIHYLIEAANSIYLHRKQGIGLTFLRRGSPNIIKAEARFRRNPTLLVAADEKS